MIPELSGSKSAEIISQRLSIAQKLKYPIPYSLTDTVPAVDMKTWLASTDKFPRFYFKSRDYSIEMAGCGIGFEINRSVSDAQWQELLNITDIDDSFIFLIGSFASNSPDDPLWRKFRFDKLIIPEVFLLRRNDDTFRCGLTITISGDENAADLINRIQNIPDAGWDQKEPSTNLELPNIKMTGYNPDFEKWKRLITTALGKIQSGDLTKVVPARCTFYNLDRSCSPSDLFTRLSESQAGNYEVFIQSDINLAFISVTPERLFSRRGEEIEIDALSSTVARGGNVEEDTRLAEQLLTDTKQRHEHQEVIDGISNDLVSAGISGIKTSPTEVMKLARLQHLYTRISAIAPQNPADMKLINVLHPTAAVCGRSRAGAMQFISDNESFDRGLYAAPIGIITPDRSEIAVAIRSLLMENQTITVFTGAGIVAGSDAEKEWQELNSKDILHQAGLTKD